MSGPNPRKTKKKPISQMTPQQRKTFEKFKTKREDEKVSAMGGYKSGGRIGRSLGGGTGLKDIPAGKKFNGLRELPTKVRNQMKFKKNGGKV
mgnify:CR=1 FL=1